MASSDAAGTARVPRAGAVKVFARSLRYVKPYWRGVLIALVLMGAYAGFNSVRTVMIGVLLDGVIVPADPVKGPGNLVRFFERWVQPYLPIDLHLTQQFTQSFHVRSFLVESGTPAGGEEWREEGGVWRAEFENGVIRALVQDNTQDGIADGRLDWTEYRSLSVRLDERPANATPPFEAGSGIVSVVQGTANRAEVILHVLVWFAIIGVVLAFLIALSHFGHEYIAQSVIVHAIVQLRADVFRRLSRMSVGYFSTRHSGDLLSRLTNDVGSLQLALRFLFGDLLQQPLVILAALCGAWISCWQLTLFVLPFLPLLLLPVIRSGPKVKRHGRGSLARLGELTQVMSELLSGIRVVKAFNMEQAQWREFDEKNAGFVRSSLKMVRAKATARTLLEGLYNLLAALLLVVGAWLLAGQALEINLGDFAGFLMAVALMYQPLKIITKSLNTIQESLAGAERVFEVMDEEPAVRDRPGATSFAPLREEIAFEDVSFRYSPARPWALRDVSLRVRRGETIALAGPSGAGKSTLLDLLARFDDPTEGRITFDGRDLRDGAHESLLEQIAIVGQEAFLFHTTIEENIRYGRPSATHGEIVASARAAAIHDEILELPEGYGTVLGDRGQTLSGGQRQRVTIARAILKGAGILILDEATSALDSESERKVQRALRNLMEGKTTFVIAHRLSTIKFADRILVLSHGRIVEHGSHDELVAAGGLYARLLEMQDSPIEQDVAVDGGAGER